jgi:predicted glycosyltransferase
MDLLRETISSFPPCSLFIDLAPLFRSLLKQLITSLVRSSISHLKKKIKEVLDQVREVEKEQNK